MKAVAPLSIQFENVSKSYAIYASPGDRLKELLTFQRASFHRDFWALRDVSFEVPRGETFCIVGENGSGKSTLLQIAAGILEPTSGLAQTHGRVAALLELGSGFNPEFSGRDNVYLNGAILGLTTEEMDRRYRDIENFAEIGDFIRQPVKTYSSGMLVRLAFSVAIHVSPEVLLVDEALSVGDIYFRQRCMRKVHELRSAGTTILFVSHSTGDIKALGDRAMWLDHGKVREIGGTEGVVTKYLAAMAEKDSAYLTNVRRDVEHEKLEAPELITRLPNVDHRFGDGRAQVLGIAVTDAAGVNLPVLEPNSSAVVRISVRAKDRVELPIVGFMLRNHLGVDFAGTNTAREGHELPPMEAGDTITVDFHLELPLLYASTFSFSPAIANGTLHHYAICDWVDNAIVLQMMPAEGPVYGQMHLPCRISVNSKLAVRAAEVEPA
jgi:ABC-type polysaccharide/polyol phosphate transport system ATPase subunit